MPPDLAALADRLPIECHYPIEECELVLVAQIVDGNVVAQASFVPGEPRWNRWSYAAINQALFAFRRHLERRLGDEVFMEFAGRRC